MARKALSAIGALILVGGLALAQSTNDTAPQVAYPDGYRTWRHLGSVVSAPNDKNRAAAPLGLIHHIYANESALEGLRSGKFEEGAIFVADWFVLKEKYPGGLYEGARNRVDVMVRDARFAATGGWGFDQFAADSRTARNVAPSAAPRQCFECHTKAETRGFVFSRLAN